MKLNLVFSLIMALFLTGCAGLTEHQKIAVGCESAASSLEALTAAKQSGRLSAAQLQDAIRLYKRAVVPVCEPPAQSLGAVQKLALDAAVADLLARKEKAK